ncbi:hypothetical protein NECAME_09876 [Necator americanus]|uniref:Uncharacterized protein n=2 Tax=Rhabditida TaxID=6236 RepID=W2TC28_NECAM|nr:hypothetical protein NECAME_09876 [Necator americanus]ETN79378.1 hypothetical protein NECAME_09876 [Necator americanus]
MVRYKTQFVYFLQPFHLSESSLLKLVTLSCTSKQHHRHFIGVLKLQNTMRSLLFYLTIFVLVDVAVSQIYLTTCARMDVPILDKAARAACITSCSIQNCGTGYCEKRGGRKTCMCSRCANGGNVPLDLLIKKKGK